MDEVLEVLSGSYMFDENDIAHVVGGEIDGDVTHPLDQLIHRQVRNNEGVNEYVQKIQYFVLLFWFQFPFCHVSWLPAWISQFLELLLVRDKIKLITLGLVLNIDQLAPPVVNPFIHQPQLVHEPVEVGNRDGLQINFVGQHQPLVDKNVQDFSLPPRPQLSLRSNQA